MCLHWSRRWENSSRASLDSAVPLAFHPGEGRAWVDAMVVQSVLHRVRLARTSLSIPMLRWCFLPTPWPQKPGQGSREETSGISTEVS